MKVAFDYDKNYEYNPLLFDKIAVRFQEAGHQVGMLTARHEKEGCPVSFKPDFIYFLDIGNDDYQTRALKKSELMDKENINILFDDRDYLFSKEKVVLKII